MHDGTYTTKLNFKRFKDHIDQYNHPPSTLTMLEKGQEKKKVSAISSYANLTLAFEITCTKNSDEPNW